MPVTMLPLNRPALVIAVADVTTAAMVGVVLAAAGPTVAVTVVLAGMPRPPNVVPCAALPESGLGCLMPKIELRS